MTGSIIAEWNACEVRSTPRGDVSAAASSASSAAMQIARARRDAQTRARSRRRARRRRAAGPASSSAGSRTDSMLPPGSACMRAPRSATRPSASASDITPASAAQTNSPTLWPISAVGVDAPAHPQPRERVLEREDRRLGLARRHQRLAGRRRRRPSRGSTPVCAWRIAQHSSKAARNAGSLR